ncbi:MAG TPA: hypothetical protein VFJ16_29950, partial [Longimicrobium sp.]|nr:hypothetical protein [Longimicrobium sp.]
MQSQAERLLAELRAHGVPMDVRQRLQVERVVALAGEGRTPAELKTLVAPILARSDEEQARIHAILDPPGAERNKRRAGVAQNGKRPSVLMPHGLPPWARAAAVAIPLAMGGGWAGVRVYRHFHPAQPAAAPKPADTPPRDSSATGAQQPPAQAEPERANAPAADSLPEIRPRPEPEPGPTRARRASGRWLLLIPGLPLLLFGL